MCQSTKNRVYAGLFAACLYLGTAAFIANQHWRPNMTAHAKSLVNAPTSTSLTDG